MSSQFPPPEEMEFVRGKLVERYDDPDLAAFCQMHFTKVYDRFGSGQRHDEKITLLIDHCRRSADEWERLKKLLEETELFWTRPRTATEAYLLSLVEQGKDLDKKYVPISGEPEGTPHTRSKEQEGLIPTSFIHIVERYYPSGEQDELKQFEAIEDALDTYLQFLLLGQPGAGKTTILKNLLYEAAKVALKDIQKPIPFFIDLGKDWVDDNEDVPGLLQRYTRIHNLRNLHPSEMFIMFDGLNELPRQQREARMQELQEWVLTHKSTRVVISCRTNYELSGFLTETPRIKINALDTNRIRRYLIANLGEVEAEVLLIKLQPDPIRASHRDLIRLASNPYFLIMIAFIYERTQLLPSSQGTLLKIFVESLYNRETERGTVENIRFIELINDLGIVALNMYKLGVPSNKMDTAWGKKQIPLNRRMQAEQLWYLGREMSILELTRNRKFFEFTHDLFTEYFAAEYLSDHPEELPKVINPPNFLGKRRISDAVDMVAYMLAGIASADKILPAISDIDPILGAECLDYLSDESRPNDETVNKIIRNLVKLLSSADADSRHVATNKLLGLPYQPQVLSHVMLCLHENSIVAKRASIEILRNSIDINRAAVILVDALVDGNKWVRNEAEEALVELADVAIEPLRSLYHKSKEAKTRKRIVGLWTRISSQRSLQCLAEALDDKDISIAKLASKTIAGLDEESTNAIIEVVEHKRKQARLMLDSSQKDNKRSAIVALSAFGTKHDAYRIAELLSTEKDEEFLKLLLDTLGELGSKNDIQIIDAVRSFLDQYREPATNPENSPRINAARILGLFRNKVASENLERALNDQENAFVRAAAALALGRLGISSAIEPLILRCKTDWNPYVISNAALSLGLIGDISATQTLIALLKEDKERIRGYAIWGLALLRQASLVTYITDALSDPNHYVRQCAANGLAILRHPSACEALGRVIQKDDSEHVRQWAALSLGAIGHADALPFLEVAIRDESHYVRTKAIAALGEIEHPSIGGLIRIAAQDENRFCRQQVALALGRIRAHEHIDILQGLVNDPSEYVRAAAAQAFGECGSEGGVNFLVELLSNDPSHFVRENAAEALGQLGILNDQVTQGLLNTLKNDEVDFVRKFVVEAIGILQIANVENHLIEQLKTEPSVYVRRKIISVLSQAVGGLNKKSIQAAISDKDPEVRKMVAKHFDTADSDVHNGDSNTSPKQPEFLASQKTSYELAMRKIEDGEVYEVVNQAILDPRKIKREAARLALWPANRGE